jgi:type II secretory pathway pseudopilin PulG
MLLGLLLMLMLAGIGLTAAVEVWSTTRQREQERELLFAGEQYRQAIRHYYFAAPPGRPRVLPTRLEDLLGDDRYPVPVRHLRRLYPDPITGSSDWGVVRVGERIAGVHSLSTAVPFRQAAPGPAPAASAATMTYRDWVFQFLPSQAAGK